MAAQIAPDRLRTSADDRAPRLCRLPEMHQRGPELQSAERQYELQYERNLSSSLYSLVIITDIGYVRCGRFGAPCAKRMANARRVETCKYNCRTCDCFIKDFQTIQYGSYLLKPCYNAFPHFLDVYAVPWGRSCVCNYDPWRSLRTWSAVARLLGQPLNKLKLLQDYSTHWCGEGVLV